MLLDGSEMQKKGGWLCINPGAGLSGQNPEERGQDWAKNQKEGGLLGTNAK